MRNSEIVSSGLSSTFMRMRGLSEDTGEAVDGLSSKLADLYATVGVEMVDQNGQLRDTFDVLGDLAEQWDTMSINQRQYFAQESAGIRQAKVFTSLMEQWDTVQQSVETSLNSTGSAMQENSKYLDSLEGKVNNVKSAWEQLSAATINSDFVKGILDGVAGLIRFADELGGLLPIVTKLVGLFVLIKAKSISEWIGGLIASLQTVGASMMGVSTATTSAAVAATGLQAAMGWIGLAAIALSTLYSGMKYLSEETERAEKKVSELSGEFNKLNANTSTVESLSQQYEELKKLKEAQGLNNEEQQKFTDIQNQLKELLPTVGGYYDDQGNYIISMSENMQTLIDKQQEYIDLKRQEYADASKDVFDDHLKAYDKEKFKLEELMRFKELYTKTQLGTNTREDLVDLTNLMERYAGMGINIDNLDESIRDLGKSSQMSLGKMQEDILNMMYVTDEWKDSTEEQKKYIQEFISSTKDVALLEKYFKDAGVSVDVLGSSLEKAVTSAKKYSSGNSGIAEYMQDLQNVSKATGIPIEDLTEIIKLYNNETNDALTPTDEFATKLDELKESSRSAMDDLDELNDVIEKVKNGEQLTGDEIIKLRDKHKDLNPVIDETTGLYTLQLDNLIDVRDGYESMSKQGIQAEIDLTKQVLSSTMQRIGLYKLELEAIKSRDDVAKERDRLDQKVGESLKGQTYGSYTPASLNVKDLSKNASKDVKDAQSALDYLSELYTELENFDINNQTKSKKDGGAKSSSKSDDPFKKSLESIRKTREQLEQEIAILQEKMNLANVMGDTSAFEKYSNEMSILLEKMRGLSAVEIGKLQDLKGTYKAQEQLAELESAIQEARKQGLIDESTYQEHMISLINTRYDLEKRAYDDKVRDLELEQLRVGEGSERYKQIEQEKYNMLLQLQQSYLEKARQLQAMGFSQNQEDVRKYIDLWKDAEEERLNMLKDMAEKRRQLEIDSLNKANDVAKEQTDALKTIHDMTMKMIKAEQDAKKKAHQDQLKAYKDEVDARKKAIQDESDERDYEKGLKEKSDKVAEIEKELLELENNNSDKAMAEKIRLQELLKQAQDDLADYQYKNEVDLRQDALDKEYEAFEEEKQKEIDKIEDIINNEYELRKMANDKLRGMNNATYKELLEYNRKYGDGIDSSVTKNWQIANEAMIEFEGTSNNVLDVMSLLADKIQTIADTIKNINEANWTDFTGNIGGGSTGGNGGTGGGSDSKLSKEGKEQLNQKKYLDSLYEQAKKENNQGLKKWVESERKKYDLDPITGKILKQRHNGILGGRLGDNLKANELILRATEDEWVFKGNQFDNLSKNLSGLVANKGGSSITLNFDKFMDVGKLDSSVDMKSIVDTAVKEMYRSLKTNFALKGVF